MSTYISPSHTVCVNCCNVVSLYKCNKYLQACVQIYWTHACIIENSFNILLFSLTLSRTSLFICLSNLFHPSPCPSNVSRLLWSSFIIICLCFMYIILHTKHFRWNIINYIIFIFIQIWIYYIIYIYILYKHYITYVIILYVI